jgi:hypothetical protein
MSEQSNEPRSEAPVRAVPVTPILGYAKPAAKVNWVFRGCLLAVAMTNVVIAVFVLWAAIWSASMRVSGFAIELTLLGLLLLLTGAMLGYRTNWGWRRSYELLVLSAVIYTGQCIVALLRLRDHSRLFDDFTMLRFILGGLIGGLNLAGAYLLCRAKRAYGAEYEDTRMRERIASAFPLPLLILITGIILLFKSHA